MDKVLTYAVVLSSPQQQTFTLRGLKSTTLIETSDMDVQAAYAARERHLTEHVEAGFRELDALRQQPDATVSGVVNADRPLYIFVAPEWMFRLKQNQFDFESAKYFTREHRTKFEALLNTLSVRNNADVLIVGGSMLWIEPKDNNSLAMLDKATSVYDAKRKAKYDDKGLQRPQQRQAREELVRTGRQEILSGREGRTYLGYNEALVSYNGHTRKSVLKSANAGDFEVAGGGNTPSDHVAMVHGLGAGVFSLDVAGNKLKVGLAICFDHSRVKEYGKNVDLYILVSCSQNIGGKEYVRKGGLILHADCRSSDSEIKGGADNPIQVLEKAPYLATRALIEVGGA